MELKPEQINRFIELHRDCAGFEVGQKSEPEVSYEYIESEIGDNGLNTAFDILFAEVLKMSVEKLN